LAGAATLLCRVKWLGWGLEASVEVPSDVAFDLSVGFALGAAAFGVGAGAFVALEASQDDGVQGAV